MRLRFLLSALVLTVAAACGGDPQVEPTATPVAVETTDQPATAEPATEEPTEEEPTEEATPDPTEEPGPAAPLTGEAITDETLYDLPVVAVKIDNDDRARPQVGLDQADVVFVEPVEGLTRLVAVFHSADPGEVGPVRSARVVDPQLFGAFDPIFTFSGAALPTYPAVDAGFPATVVNDRDVNRWRREGTRPAPHNLFIALADVRTIAGDVAGPGDVQAFARDAAVPAGGTTTDGFTVDYGSFRTQSGWTWQEGAGWVRAQDGTPHTASNPDRTSESPIVTENVVVITVPTTGGQAEPVTVIGTGEARVHRNGQVWQGTWTKATPEDQYTFTNSTGGVLALAPGSTWIEVLPSSGGYVPGAPFIAI